MSQAVLDRPKAATADFPVLGAISFCHMLNDLLQALLPAVYTVHARDDQPTVDSLDKVMSFAR